MAGLRPDPCRISLSSGCRHHHCKMFGSVSEPAKMEISMKVILLLHGTLPLSFSLSPYVSLMRICTLKPAFTPRYTLPLEDCTSYELMLALEAQEPPWTWQKWIPRSRQKKSALLPVGYAPGDTPTYFSNPDAVTPVLRQYLMALLRAEDLHRIKPTAKFQ